MADLFKEVTHPYSLRKSLISGSNKIKTVRYSTETIANLDSKIYQFRQKIKLRKPDSCS